MRDTSDDGELKAEKTKPRSHVHEELRCVGDARGWRFVVCEYDKIRRHWQMHMMYVVSMQAACAGCATDMVVACMVHETEMDKVL
jgi:hypothetical protein